MVEFVQQRISVLERAGVGKPLNSPEKPQYIAHRPFDQQAALHELIVLKLLMWRYREHCKGGEECP